VRVGITLVFGAAFAAGPTLEAQCLALFQGVATPTDLPTRTRSPTAVFVKLQSNLHTKCMQK
jgi:hypothetical protein